MQEAFCFNEGCFFYDYLGFYNIVLVLVEVIEGVYFALHPRDGGVLSLRWFEHLHVLAVH